MKVFHTAASPWYAVAAPALTLLPVVARLKTWNTKFRSVRSSIAGSGAMCAFSIAFIRVVTRCCFSASRSTCSS
ncbi:hypothetical protein [Amycolatopsis sp. BJA-103]|uniref:hypothetical protein n=1 Tax=Amycolatopsis sp. BJA-103 TaxID=1911175 RepID=UPI0013053206